MAADFDLLATHDLVESAIHDEHEDEKLLIWKKLSAEGFQPSARTGHTCVSIGYGAVAFGGVEAGQRVNSSLYFDLVNSSWSILRCKGDTPSPRCFHAACGVDALMIVHGGEGYLMAQTASGPFWGLTVDDTFSSVASRQKGEKPQYRPSNPMEGVCPGDNLQDVKYGANTANSTIFKVSSSDIGEASKSVSCLDDFYALDCASLTWVRVACTLGPLPRKGHTMNVCSIYGKKSIAIFGGYSLETAVVSNSLLVCEVEAVNTYVSNAVSLRRSFLGQPTLPTTAEPNRPVVWRSVLTKGALPCGRYRHSTTIVSTEREDLMVVIGGVGKDASSALSDVHILNLGSLTWVELKSAAPTSQGKHLHAGEGPFLGVFGHSAFFARKPVSATNYPDYDSSWHGSEEYEVMIFGGSSHPNDVGAHGYHSLFAFDLQSHEWRRAATGPDFPPSRCFHATAYLPQWSPSHELPFARSSLRRNLRAGSNQLQRTKSMHQGIVSKESDMVDDESDFYLDLSGFPANNDPASAGSVLIFGGLSITKAVADVWVLDLCWKSAGLTQFDDTMSVRLRDQLQESYPPDEKVDIMVETGASSRVPFSPASIPPSSSQSKIMTNNNAKYLSQSLPDKPSKLLGSMSVPLLPTQSTVEPSRTNKMKLIQHLTSASQQFESSRPEIDDDAVLKIRKERALADMQLKEEKERLGEAERKIAELSTVIDNLTTKYEAELTQKNDEIGQLKALLMQSLEREKKLASLNSEAYSLLSLYGVNHL